MKKTAACFRKVIKFDITIPSDYDHDTCLRCFREKCGERMLEGKSKIPTDEGYKKVTTRLYPGQKFKVGIFEIQHASSDECLNYLHSEEAVLVGAQGLTVVFDYLLLNDLLGNFCDGLLSFDEKDLLWHNLVVPMVPKIRPSRCRRFYFEGDSFDTSWSSEGLDHKGNYYHYLLCFYRWE